MISLPLMDFSSSNREIRKEECYTLALLGYFNVKLIFLSFLGLGKLTCVWLRRKNLFERLRNEETLLYQPTNDLHIAHGKLR